MIVDHGDISVAENSHEQLYSKVDKTMAEIIQVRMSTIRLISMSIILSVLDMEMRCWALWLRDTARADPTGTWRGPFCDISSGEGAEKASRQTREHYPF